MIDAVSYNTLMKAHLMKGDLSKARKVMEDMRKEGFQPNRVTFNEILNATVVLGSCRSDIWQVVKEMREASIPPNQVTCSILLKSINAKSSDTDILLTMDLIESIEEPMDEVMLSSVVEACVRIDKPDILTKKLQQLQGKERIVLNTSHTCGSLIKAYGHAKDLEGVWRIWKEMRSKLIKPTSITLGCMIEAVSSNSDTEGAYELIHEMQQDEQCQDVVNSVIYCSILKGFAREKKVERVWDVYKEMCARNVEMSLITFNTIIDACARSGRMDNLPKIMEDMRKHYVEPNIVTYSTILKGHCQTGDIQLGFATLRDMRRQTKLKPDEIMYNSLLDGCAKNNLFEEGLQLFEEMMRERVSPSNFTLSIMVKLLNRARKIEEAFKLVEQLPREYRFKPNAHVYTNLIQACIGNRQQGRALAVLEKMVNEKVRPDCRVYSVLIRASLYQNNCVQAAALLRTALRLPGALALDSQWAACSFIEAGLVNETLISLVDYGCAQSLGAPLLADIKKCKVKVTIDQAVTRRIAYGVTGTADTGASKGKGKGKAQKGGW
jgi:pentatricopeptide repeat protein